MKDLFWYGILLLIGFAGFLSCATPSSPTGGPPDEEGPVIVRTEPITGTTNFDDQTIILHFSDFVNRSSLNQAIVVEPDIGIPYELDWGRKSVKIVFAEAIPDTTTLIITIGTEFQDVNGNEMESPQKVAVSTGPEIDEGKLLGRVINAETGEGNEGHRVLLYRYPADLSQQADYIAATDTGGTFQFSYLRQGEYQALWVDDRNRNKIWDPQQERALPFGQQSIHLAEAQADTLGTIFITEVDTTFPGLQGVGLFSSQRMRLRFSEGIQLTDSTQLTVTDTLGNEYAEAIPLYIQPEEPFVLFAHSEQALQETDSYSINVSGITDFSGNPNRNTEPHFTGSSQEDTTQQRIITRNNLSGYYPDDPIEVVYAKPIAEEAIRDSLKVIQGTELIEDWEPIELDANVLRILPDGRWKDGISYEFRVWDPIIEDYRNLQPTIWHASQMGSLNVVAQDSTLKNLHLQVENEEAGIVRDTVFSQSATIPELPALEYKVQAFLDKNNNGAWDMGQVEPYIPPEPYFIQTDVPVRQNMTSDLILSFSDR